MMDSLALRCEKRKQSDYRDLATSPTPLHRNFSASRSELTDQTGVQEPLVPD